MLVNKYLSNIKWLFSDTVIRLVLTFAVSVFVARYMGVSNFGLYSYLLAIFSIFISLSSLGMNGIVVRELVLTNHPEKILGSALFLQRLGAVFTSVILILWVLFFNNNKHEDFIVIFFLILPTLLIQATNVYKYWFEFKVKSKFIVVAQNLSIFIGVVLKFIIIYQSLDYKYIIAVTIVEQLILVNMLTIFFKKNTDFVLKSDKKICFDLVNKSWPLILSGLAFILYIRLDQIMIGEILGISQVGIFSVAVKFIEVSFFIPVILMSTFAPMLVSLREKSISDYNKKMQRIYDLVSILGYLIIIFIFIFGELLIKYTFGAEYSDSTLQMKIYSFVCLFYFLNSVSGKWYINEGLQKVALFRNILGLVVAIVLNILLIPKYGLTGASLSTVISYVFSAYLYDFFDSRTRIVFYQKTHSLFVFGALNRLRLEYFK